MLFPSIVSFLWHLQNDIQHKLAAVLNKGLVFGHSLLSDETFQVKNPGILVHFKQVLDCLKAHLRVTYVHQSLQEKQH